ncbi:(Fe-S)-binding protein [Sporolituus thermophilus]|uniref:Fe-S oxidoreductase n=1 Tax=Sporolituus thermophilus DSM 23256 TaxID=1123285 RepID=A0A1G7K6C6_9FIRM|nr:(Fe-S)-binding protein [Sporolituus thermophilus]SDF32805.1 Fe-S oxidoreductase [Sporolituus thermophilus DSM 23256]
MKQRVRIKDLAKPADILSPLDVSELQPVPGYEEKPFKPVKPDWMEKYDFSLDGFSALGLPKPQSKEEEDALVNKFLRGLEKLFKKENNWTFLMPALLSTEYCVRCNTCNEACPVYTCSGRQDIYRPNYRSEVLRKIYRKYFTTSGRLLSSFVGADIDLNWRVIYRLAELSYRCSICRRCASTCPIGVDNGLLTRELRKLFSQELGIAPEAVHKNGTMRHLQTGSSTGMTPAAFLDTIEFIEDDIEEKIGRRIKIPVDKKGADILLIHNAGEYVAWPENPAAFAILFEAAGLSWTLSSEVMGYEGVNYGTWYDDVQYSRIAVAQVQAAKKLGVKKIVVGECGHATKALVEIADRVCIGDLAIPRESCLPLLEQIVTSGVIKFDPARNNFPVTLHDPCNIVRLMGIVNPQRNIIKRIVAPGQFREMPHAGTQNYCCGGGSGFAIMNSYNFPEWRNNVIGRAKALQVLEAFKDCLDPSIPKYYCAPCSNCKGSARDILQEHYEFKEKYNIIYGGLVELMVNAMVDLPAPFIKWEDEF